MTMAQLSKPCILLLISGLLVVIVFLLLVEFNVLHLHSHLASQHPKIKEFTTTGVSVEVNPEEKLSLEVERLLHSNSELREIIQNEYNETEKEGLYEEMRKSYKKYFVKTPEESVRFYLFDDPSYTPTYQEILPAEVKSFKVIHVPNNVTLKILIPGFFNHSNNSFTHDLKNAFLENTSSPVICIDWSEMTNQWRGITGLEPVTEKFLYYNIVKKNIPRVGEFIGKFVSSLKKYRVVESLTQVHIIGHGIGAHIAAEAGTTVQADLEGEKVGRITGLDPSAPLFREVLFERRLDETDGKFVDIIHTSYFLGDRMPRGHVDFYPNSDSKPQPGCIPGNDSSNSTIANNFIGFAKFKSNSCDHKRAIDYYIKSITDDSLYGCKLVDEESEKKLKRCSSKCSKGVIFGEHILPRTRGKYCLKILFDENIEITSM